MPISFIEIPSDYWQNHTAANEFSSLFQQVRVTEKRIFGGINVAVERKRHHKICTVIENKTRKLVEEGSAGIVAEFPLIIEGVGTVPSSSFLQLTELLMATTDTSIMSIASNNKMKRKSVRPIAYSLFKRFVLFIIQLLSKKKEIVQTSNISSINIPFDPSLKFEENNSWLCRFSDTPTETAEKYALYFELHGNSFENYFGEYMNTQITGYQAMLSNLLRIYKTATNSNAGLVVIVDADFPNTENRI